MSSQDEQAREDADVQDKMVEKIHKEEGLDEKDNYYDIDNAQSDSNDLDAEKDNTGT